VPCVARFGTVTAMHELYVLVWCVLSVLHSPCALQSDWVGCGVRVCAVVGVGVVMLGGWLCCHVWCILVPQLPYMGCMCWYGVF
jgi:hypothetical protein